MTSDSRRLDAIRRNRGPLEVDLIESFAQGRLSRRDFMRRGVILGLTVPQLGLVAAACRVSAESDGALQATGAGPTLVAPPPTAAVIPTATPQPTRPPTTPAPTPAESPTPQQTSDSPTSTLSVGVLVGDANSGLDPVNMIDLGTYGVVSQSFEYLVGLGADGFIGTTGLATGWAPNADATQWTFELRPNVMWHDGSAFTSADVAATIDRMVAVGAGLAGVVSQGAVETQSDLTVVINLDRPSSIFPVLVSIFNPQSLITPRDYTDGTTLDQRPAGTGPWLFDNHDPVTFTTTFVANDNYWGGRPTIDSITLAGFETEVVRVAAMAAGELDVIQQFSTFDGGILLDDPTFEVLSPPSANHRQVWFNTRLPDGGSFTDRLVRQAVAHCLDRERMVSQVFGGRGVVGNDHPVHPTLPFFDGSAVPQRSRDIELARSLLAEAGVDGVAATIEVGDIVYSPDMAQLLTEDCVEAGIAIEINVNRNSDFYGDRWCAGASYGAQPETSGPGIPCGASAEIGIVDYGHRPTPDVIFGRTLATDGDWNASNYSSSTFDQLFAEYQGAIDVEGQTRAASQIQQLLHEDSPVLIPAFYDYLAGHSSNVSGVHTTALGHLDLARATKTG